MRAARPGLAPAGPDGPRFPGGRPPTTQEIEGAMEFARDSMPNLYRMLEEAPPRSRRRGRIFGHALREYRRYRDVSDSPAAVAAVIERARSQDELFALVREYRNASPEQQNELRRRLREKMLDVVRDSLREREQRIERLKDLLEREDRALSEDRDRIEEAARDRADRLLRETGAARTEPTTASDDSEIPDRPR